MQHTMLVRGAREGGEQATSADGARRENGPSKWSDSTTMKSLADTLQVKREYASIPLMIPSKVGCLRCALAHSRHASLAWSTSPYQRAHRNLFCRCQRSRSQPHCFCLTPSRVQDNVPDFVPIARLAQPDSYARAPDLAAESDCSKN